MSVVGSQQRTLIELLAQLRPHWRQDRNLPARIQTLLARNRSFGSRDRRLYRELIYTTLRYLPWLEADLEHSPEEAVRGISWLAADLPSTANFRRSVTAGWPECPANVAGKAAALNAVQADTEPSFEDAPRKPDDLLPDWLRTECPEAFNALQIDALHRRAPLWLRVHPAAIDRVTAEFNLLGWQWRTSAVLSNALQILDEVDVTKTTSFEQGAFEVQDLGSQLLLESAGITTGGRWLDACAGAGGKTLQLAQLLGPSASIEAYDVRPAALAELAARAKRAHLRTITVITPSPGKTYDGVLVDAPCSGSGTWRRSPHLKWVTTPRHIIDAVNLQGTILTKFSACVRPGGRLVYSTCSLNRSENEAVIADFLDHHPDFSPEQPHCDFGGIVRGGGLSLLPALHDNDGFFVAALRRRD